MIGEGGTDELGESCPWDPPPNEEKKLRTASKELCQSCFFISIS